MQILREQNRLIYSVQKFFFTNMTFLDLILRKIVSLMNESSKFDGIIHYSFLNQKFKLDYTYSIITDGNIEETVIYKYMEHYQAYT